MSAYRTTARREGDWWIVSVEGVGVTQARRLEHVEAMARDLVATMEDVAADTVDIELDVRVNDELDRLRGEWTKVAAEADRLLEKARAGKEFLMRQLAEAKLPARDIGRLTGVSHQRVSQVVGKSSQREPVTEIKTAARESLEPRRLAAQRRQSPSSLPSEPGRDPRSGRRELMATNKKQTSAKAAKSASKVLRDGRTSKSSKSAAGSALSQTTKRKGK